MGFQYTCTAIHIGNGARYSQAAIAGTVRKPQPGSRFVKQFTPSGIGSAVPAKIFTL
jgi:hypothetical protein